MNEEPKKIEVVNGDGTELDISEVSTHIPELKPKIKTEDNKQEIVIPQAKKKCCNKNKK